VAITYKRLMGIIGVSINDSKSMVSDRANRRFEFSKRIVLGDKEITGIRPSLIRSSSRSIYNVMDLIDWTESRHWDLHWTGIEDLPLPSLKGKEFLAVLLAERKGLVPAFAVTLDAFRTIPLDVAALKRETIRERIASLVQKQGAVERRSRHLKVAKPQLWFGNTKDNLNSIFRSRGVSVPEHLLGDYGDISLQHPIRIAFTDYNKKLFACIEALEAALEGGNTPEELPIEYMPVISGDALFGDLESLKTEYHSRIVIKA